MTGDGGSYSDTSDGFDDFWFGDLKVATFSLKIEAKGFASKTIDNIKHGKGCESGRHTSIILEGMREKPGSLLKQGARVLQGTILLAVKNY